MKQSRSRIEQETTITFNAEEGFALVGSCYEPFKRKMLKRNAEIHRKDGEWITWKVSKKLIRIGMPRPPMSEEAKKKTSERMSRMRSLMK